ncbi:pyrophosphohydrolase domain-containing protein [Vagococcus vulneris]|uniref:HAD family hydrolase n=1 Tax=Vagococcus vulneris TaxID=1977869 RepID=A0A429ZY25_9ENTE|nr:HAD family hydrolase [Vagococcus vulneris]RST98797.1 HAD family hydrolase [Vagococcus vulneris]
MSYFEKVSEFHRVFDPNESEEIRTLSDQEAEYRTSFKLEELIEFLYAASDGDNDLFDSFIAGLHDQMDQQAEKIKKQPPVHSDKLVGEVDALIDLLYFTFGTFVKMGINPEPIFDIVHAANMGKLFPDGQPHYHDVTGKVLKPDNWERDFAPELKIKAAVRQQQNKSVSD